MSYLRTAAKPLSGVALLAAQILRAAHRKDIPSLQNQDPSGVFGEPGAPTLRIAVMGDSSVTAPGVEPLDAAWPRQMAIRLADRYRVELHSVAVGGAKSRDVLASQVHKAILLEPDIAIVSVGSNDALRATFVARFEREYDQILGLLSSRVPGIAVSGIGDLGSIPRLPALPRSIVRIRGRAFDHAIRRVASRYPRVLKTDTWSLGWEEFLTNPGQVFAADLFHASAYGHRIYTEAIMPAIDALIERRSQQLEEGFGS